MKKILTSSVIILCLTSTSFGASEIPIKTNSETIRFNENVVEQKQANAFYCIEEKSKSLHSRQIKISFTNPLEPKTALDLKNFQINGGLNLKSAVFDKLDNGTTDYKTILLETDLQVPERVYTLTFKDSLQDQFGQKLNVDQKYRSVTFYGHTYDIYSPKVERIVAKAYDTVQLIFTETSGIDRVTGTDPANYKIYDLDTKQNYKVISVELEKNRATGVYDNVVLKTEPLQVRNRYMVEVIKVKDVQQNEISNQTGFRGSFAFSEENDKTPKLMSVTPFSPSLLQLTFDKVIQVPKDYKLDQIELGSNAKVISIIPDQTIHNILWVKTSAMETGSFNTLKIGGIEDGFGNVTSKGETRQFYSINPYEFKSPQLNNIENDIYRGKNILTLNFSSPLDPEVSEQLAHYNVDGLELIYAYQTGPRQVRIVTGIQDRLKHYNLELHGLTDQWGESISFTHTVNRFQGRIVD